MEDTQSDLHNDDDDDDDDDDVSLEDDGYDIELGFVKDITDFDAPTLFQNVDWTKWVIVYEYVLIFIFIVSYFQDNGKIGGFPNWLNKRDIPAPPDLQCGVCAEQMIFLLQLYAPLDNVKDAFHRALYLFCCHRGTCIKSNPSLSVKAIRCQLPKNNDFYPFDPKSAVGISSCQIGLSTTDISQLPFLCAVCGCRAPMQCSACRTVHYCSKSHQKLHWKRCHKAQCGSDTADGTTITLKAGKIAPQLLAFPEYEIEVLSHALLCRYKKWGGRSS